ncbi:MAG: SRPBCC family protein [Candidatus Peribacteria bacterium]|jgi:hypothetical protein|nr:SRPBCC family protein [Candidatus Peribacteria bacterium]
MIVLTDSIDISVSLHELYHWLEALDKNFVKWSPSHEYFYKLDGGVQVGDRIQFRETVEDVSYTIKGVIQQHSTTKDSFHIVFTTMSGIGRIHFIGEKIKSGVHFTHIEEFGKSDTLFGRIFSWLLFNIFARKKANWQRILDDMKRDNKYLKQILEEGKYPRDE